MTLETRSDKRSVGVNGARKATLEARDGACCSRHPHDVRGSVLSLVLLSSCAPHSIGDQLGGELGKWHPGVQRQYLNPTRV